MRVAERPKGSVRTQSIRIPGNRHAVLITFFFSGTHIGDLETVAGKLPESADVSRSYKRCFYNVKAEQVSNPFRITLVSLLAFDSFHIIGVREDDMHMWFEDVKNGNPVFTSGIHTDIEAVLCEKPVARGGAI